MEGIPTGWKGMKESEDPDEKLEVAPAMILLYLNHQDHLVPIAIQLGQHPGPDCPIWTKKDSEDDWFLAKTWVRNADAQVAQICNHLARTHFFLEPFALALHRCLAPVHPIFKMLKEHLRFIISINISIIISINTSSGSSSPSTPWAGRSSLHQGAAPMSVFPWVTVRRESRISWQRPSRRWSGTSLTTWAT